MMEYCMECGTKLKDRFLKNEGMIPFCEKCNAYRFPVFSAAVSMEVLSPDRDKVLLIKQYGRDRYILVAGYINKGENAEHTVAREVMEEIGLHVDEIHFEKSEYFPPSNNSQNSRPAQRNGAVRVPDPGARKLNRLLF